MIKRSLLLVCMVCVCFFSAYAADWSVTAKKAKGQTVYWNAWGGSPTINSYIAWIGEQVKDKYGVTLVHVKLQDTADAVSRVLSEKQANKDTGGSIDLIWINGENFRKMKEGKLLWGPFSEQLPNYSFTDYENKVVLKNDFGTPVEGYESPWGLSQFIFMYDTAITKNPPLSARDILAYAKKNPGRVAYPKPPDFTGTTFLKQMLYDLVEDPQLLQKEVSEKDFQKYSRPLWDWLKQLKAVSWGKGKTFPKNDVHLVQLLNDGEVDIAFSFAIGSASAAIKRGDLPDTVRTFVLKKGTIGNAHFVAIPYNSSSTEGAMVVANFLLSVEAQAKKLQPELWGDYTVLNVEKLSAKDRARIKGIDTGIATLKPNELGKALLEPHYSWAEKIEKEWNSIFSE